MKIDVLNEKKLVAVWLTNAEKNDLELRESLKPLYAKYRKKKYLVAVYESGEDDLYQGTRDLLLHNRTLAAQKEVQKQKKQSALELEM